MNILKKTGRHVAVALIGLAAAVALASPVRAAPEILTVQEIAKLIDEANAQGTRLKG